MSRWTLLFHKFPHCSEISHVGIDKIIFYSILLAWWILHLFKAHDKMVKKTRYPRHISEHMPNPHIPSIYQLIYWWKQGEGLQSCKWCFVSQKRFKLYKHLQTFSVLLVDHRHLFSDFDDYGRLQWESGRTNLKFKGDCSVSVAEKSVKNCKDNEKVMNNRVIE